MKKLFLVIVLVLELILIQSCHKEVQHNIPIEFESYVNNFFYEAEIRKMDLRLQDVSLSIEYAQLPNDRAGQCRSSKHLIEIKKKSWTRFTTEQKEHLIAHELGHCLLDRNHRNELSISNEDISIMQGEKIGSFNLFSKKWKKYYYDELFNPCTPLPNWHFSNIISIPSLNQFISFSSLVDELIIDSIAFNTFENFSIYVNYKNWRESTKILELEFGNISLLYADSGGIKIKNDLDGVLFSSERMSISGDIQFEIRKIDQDIYILVNNKYFHCFEYDLITGNNILIDFDHRYVEVDIRINK